MQKRIAILTIATTAAFLLFTYSQKSKEKGYGNSVTKNIQQNKSDMLRNDSLNVADSN